MRLAGLSALILLATPALAEMKDEEHLVGDKMVKIAVVDTFEILTVGPSDYEQMQVLSGTDIEILAIVDDPDRVARLGQPVLVAEVTGTHSCETGDARALYVVTLGEVPTPEGPLSTCEAMAVSVTSSEGVQLQGATEAWVWVPGKGWTVAAN
jgi:hypothetical protein